MLVLTALGDGPQRFHELRARVEGVSEKTLSQPLFDGVRDHAGDNLAAQATHDQAAAE
ncbi:winged helix-turn-helix transcriptional regulator [[Actinomadura] parvosata]|uniref:winged helix-turn-helix transcriptional regulator n=1 Tax=[Actinomadura] parvosata TaxID=1955412 RepID=UPI00406D348E